MTGVEWAMLVALSLIWGCSFLFSKVAVADIPPFSLVFGRVALASLCLLAVLRAIRVAVPAGLPVWRDFLGMGLLNNIIPFSLIFWGQTQIGAGLSSILNATTPLFTVLVANALTTDEKLTPPRLAGVLLGFAGVAVMLGPELLASLDRHVAAELACLAAAVSYAFSSVFGRRFARMGVKPAQAAFGQLSASSLVMLPVVLLADRPWTLPMPHAVSWAALVALGVLCTAFAYLIFFRILGGAGATNIMLVTFLIPPSAILLGALVLGERLGARDVAGMALVALGLAAIDRRGPALARRLIGRGRTEAA
ncbi:MAG: DMT family transporter [Alsobacter sp.]